MMAIAWYFLLLQSVCSSHCSICHVMIDIGMQEALGRLPYLVALDAEQRAAVRAVP